MKILLAWLVAALFTFGFLMADDEFRDLEPGAVFLGAFLFWPAVIGDYVAKTNTTTIVKSDRLACDGRGE